MPNKSIRILVLGGTEEARLLASRLDGDDRYAPVTSLAGVTQDPEPIDGETRSGGFGGAAGLEDFIKSEAVELVIDAAHPFAATISANAVKASERAGVACLRLERPPWGKGAGDNWTPVPDVEQAVRAIPEGARAFVTVGRQEIALFFARGDIHVIARMIEPPVELPPADAEVILARPPFTLAQERNLMAEKKISVLVTKNAGSAATRPKVDAARELGLPVIMVSRPGKPTVPTAQTVEGVIDLVERSIA